MQRYSTESKLDAVENKWGLRDASLVQKHRPPENLPCECCKTPMTYGQEMNSM